MSGTADREASALVALRRIGDYERQYPRDRWSPMFSRELNRVSIVDNQRRTGAGSGDGYTLDGEDLDWLVTQELIEFVPLRDDSPPSEFRLTEQGRERYQNL